MPGDGPPAAEAGPEPTLPVSYTWPSQRRWAPCAPSPSLRSGPASFHPDTLIPVGVSREPALSRERCLPASPRAASSPSLRLILRAAAAVAHQGRRTHGASSTARRARQPPPRAPGIPPRRKCPPGGGTCESTSSGRGLEGRGAAGPSRDPTHRDRAACRWLRAEGSPEAPGAPSLRMRVSQLAPGADLSVRGSVCSHLGPDLPAADSAWVSAQRSVDSAGSPALEAGPGSEVPYARRPAGRAPGPLP